ncbi:MAG TPA: hypothetical protein VFM13_12800 [Gaiellaceae bacterium]|nr:hypothetical protein [Gaiellaceae bacterium]
MDTVLGLIGMVLFVVGTISLAAGVTYAIVRISPTNRRKNGSAKPAKPAA